MEERDYEAEAKLDGWLPRDEWTGDPEKHKTAQEFVEAGEKIGGILKSKIGRLEERIESLTQSNAEFKKFTDAQLSKEQEKNKKLISELEQARKEAITDGDGEAFNRADQRINELRNNTNYDTHEHSQMANQWTIDNPWYVSNEKLGRYADGIAEQVVAQGYTGQAYFNELTRRVKATFPEEFSNPNKARSSVETGGDKEVKDSKTRKWENLPEEAKAAAIRFEKNIPGFKREEYLANYDWE